MPGNSIQLQPAAIVEQSLLANLLELYLHDLSEAFPIEIGLDGRYGYHWLPLYFSEPQKRFPFLIRAGETVHGFALATRGSPASQDADVYDVAEFFILRRYRRSGSGREAAKLLWNHLPGRWIVRVSEGNPSGMRFWESTIQNYTNGHFSVTHRPGNRFPWRDFHFRSASQAQDGF